MEDLWDVPNHWFAHDESVVEVYNLLSPVSKNTKKRKQHLEKVKFSQVYRNYSKRVNRKFQLRAYNIWGTAQVTTHTFTYTQNPNTADE